MKHWPSSGRCSVKKGFVLMVTGGVAFAVAGATAHWNMLCPLAAQAAAKRTAVVIELFTSEGCSSCPPVDALLSELEAKQPIEGVEIIPLEEHVDYWNHDGWQDPFSGQEWTQRQQQYVAKFNGETPYTPQMILNGGKVMALKNSAEVQEDILQAAKEQKMDVSVVEASSDKSDALKFDLRAENLPGTSEVDKVDVWLAVTEDGLHSDVTAGENKGKTLEHAAVVRSLRKVGSAGGTSTPFAANVEIKLKPTWKKENLRVVVFVQDRRNWRILGAATAKVS
jgi:hypothetical protein